jgi:S-methylmethionine-dependent homocysteine/selenocysteine methylase
LIETQNTIREAVAAARAVARTKTPLLISFVCGQDGRLLSGESIHQAVAAVRPFSPLALLVNCIPAGAVYAALEQLRTAAANLPVGAYGNIGRPDPAQGWINDSAEDPQSYADHAHRWLNAGAKLVGGCCGTTPAHIRLLKSRIDLGPSRPFGVR